MPTNFFRTGMAPQGSRPSPVSMMGSACAGFASGVAKVKSWPSARRTCQVTAASVGSKSWAGSGIRILAMATPELVWCLAGLRRFAASLVFDTLILLSHELGWPAGLEPI